MKTLYKIAISCLFILVLVSCSQDKKQEELLYKVVLDKHDEVMPEMGNLVRLTRQIDAILSSDTLNTDSISNKNGTLLVLKKDLEDANESMMAWMRQFEPVEEGTPHEQVMEYLKNQKIGIELVQQQVENAKQNAEKYFAEN